MRRPTVAEQPTSSFCILHSPFDILHSHLVPGNPTFSQFVFVPAKASSLKSKIRLGGTQVSVPAPSKDQLPKWCTAPHPDVAKQPLPPLGPSNPRPLRRFVPVCLFLMSQACQDLHDHQINCRNSTAPNFDVSTFRCFDFLARLR
jgi:hypothetical protein